MASLVLAAIGCSSANPSGSGRSGSSSAATTSTATQVSSSSGSTSTTDPRAAAQQALDAYWRLRKRLNAAPDPNDPELAQRAADPSLSATRDLLTTRQAQGLVVRYDGVPYRVDTPIDAVDGQSATFAGCIVDGGVLVNSASGQIVNDKVTTSRVQGSMVLGGDQWRVQRYDVLRKVDGEVACGALA